MSNYGIWIVIIIFCIVLPSIRSRNAAAYHHIRKKRRKEVSVMNKIVMDYVGKECLIYTINNAYVEGVIESAEDGWIVVRSFKGNTTEAVNVEYITRIKEYPRDKNGKRKSVVFG